MIDADEKPVEGAKVLALFSDRNGSRRSFLVRVETDARGSFAVEDLPRFDPGIVMVDAGEHGSWPDEERNFSKGIALEGDSYLPKPFTAAELLSRVRQLVDRVPS